MKHFLILLVCLLVGCTIVRRDDGPIPDETDVREAAAEAIVAYSALLSEVYEDAADKVQSGEFKHFRDYNDFVTEQNRKVNAASFQKLRDLIDNDTINDDQELEQDETREWLIEFSREVAEGVK